MPNINKCIFAGHLTRDVELRYTPKGTAVAAFSIAINYKEKDYEETAFIDCRMFGKRGETLSQYFSKGSAILVEGRMKTESWEGKDGRKQSKLVCTVENFHFVGGNKTEKKQEERDMPDIPDDEIPF